MYFSVYVTHYNWRTLLWNRCALCCLFFCGRKADVRLQGESRRKMRAWLLGLTVTADVLKPLYVWIGWIKQRNADRYSKVFVAVQINPHRTSWCASPLPLAPPHSLFLSHSHPIAQFGLHFVRCIFFIVIFPEILVIDVKISIRKPTGHEANCLCVVWRCGRIVKWRWEQFYKLQLEHKWYQVSFMIGWTEFLDAMPNER